MMLQDQLFERFQHLASVELEILAKEIQFY